MSVMKTRILTALPVYNEVSHVADVLTELKQHVDDILVVDDGSTDGTADLLKQIPGICVERHARNLGYGAALNTAFQYALEHGFDVLVTMDCDGQHQPRFVREIASMIDESSDTPIDMISGSRYLKDFAGDNAAPADRQSDQQAHHGMSQRGAWAFDYGCVLWIQGVSRVVACEAGHHRQWLRDAAAAVDSGGRFELEHS
jgi:glycosyltransferase involved in cell wall biosynthesis